MLILIHKNDTTASILKRSRLKNLPFVVNAPSFDPNNLKEYLEDSYTLHEIKRYLHKHNSTFTRVMKLLGIQSVVTVNRTSDFDFLIRIRISTSVNLGACQYTSERIKGPEIVLSGRWYFIWRTFINNNIVIISDNLGK